jgi:two-component sensor histidine kinase
LISGLGGFPPDDETCSGAKVMGDRVRESDFPIPLGRPLGRDRNGQTAQDALADELQAALGREQEALGREQVLLQEKNDIAQRHAMLAQEFEHRLINGLQLIVSLLSLQSRTATTPEAADQLIIAARRVGALGRVHRRLHLLDHQDHVEFKEYLQHLCEDLSSLLVQARGHAIVVEGAQVEIPTTLAIPLGFIVNELITNSAKYAKGNITVRVETTSPPCHSLSVLDDGPGLPAGFDPAKSKGLGMKIVLSLVKQIGGELHILRGDNGRGAHLRVTF